MNRSLLVLVIALTLLVVPLASGAATHPSRQQTFSYLLRASRNTQSLGNLEMRRRKDSVSLADAIRVFGKPSWCRALQYRDTALARWQTKGSLGPTAGRLRVE